MYSRTEQHGTSAMRAVCLNVVCNAGSPTVVGTYGSHREPVELLQIRRLQSGPRRVHVPRLVHSAASIQSRSFLLDGTAVVAVQTDRDLGWVDRLHSPESTGGLALASSITWLDNCMDSLCA